MPDYSITELKLGQVGILTHVDGRGPSVPGDIIIGGWDGSFVCPRTKTGGFASEWAAYRFREPIAADFPIYSWRVGMDF